MYCTSAEMFFVFRKILVPRILNGQGRYVVGPLDTGRYQLQSSKIYFPLNCYFSSKLEWHKLLFKCLFKRHF